MKLIIIYVLFFCHIVQKTMACAFTASVLIWNIPIPWGTRPKS